MNEQEIVELVAGIIDEASYMDEEDRSEMGLEHLEEFEDSRTANFAEVGMLTMNSGFVLTMPDGSEFQIEVKQSKRASR